MTLTREHAQRVIDVYIQAWVEQDPDLVVTIFTETAVYHERVLEEPIRNREGIRAYWDEKVLNSQDRIECELLSLYVDGDTAIAEWDARFDDHVEGTRKWMREVAILEFQDGLIARLREYWSSRPLGAISSDFASSG